MEVHENLCKTTSTREKLLRVAQPLKFHPDYRFIRYNYFCCTVLCGPVQNETTGQDGSNLLLLVVAVGDSCYKDPRLHLFRRFSLYSDVAICRIPPSLKIQYLIGL